MVLTDEEKAQMNAEANEKKKLREKKRADLKDTEVKQLQEMLSIREMLERKLGTDIIEIPLKNDLGPFVLRFNKLSTADHDKKLVPSMAGTTDPVKSQESFKALCSLLGAASLDGLDAGYWEAGTGFSGDVLNTILLHLKSASTKPDKDAIAKFREK